MIIEHDPNLRALQREWLAARLMGALGAILLLGVVTITTVAQMTPTAPQVALPTAIVPSDGTPATPARDAEARRQEDIALCNAALGTVQALGIVPGFASRDGDAAKPSGAQGRYVCGAKTDAARYAITFDLACTHLGDANCIVPVSIVQDGTRILYQRK